MNKCDQVITTEAAQIQILIAQLRNITANADPALQQHIDAIAYQIETALDALFRRANDD